MKRALLPGSFDPPTIGHLDLIRRAAALFDEVYPVVFVNAEKHTMFTPQQRLELLQVMCEGLENVHPALSDGLVVDYLAAHGIDCLVKGARNGQDFDYEASLADINRVTGGAETILLPTLPELRFVSSTFVREMIRYDRNYADYTGEKAAALIGEWKKGN